jgi:rod shape-determining protein MreD
MAYYAVPLLLGVALFQSTVMPYLRVFGVMPNLMLMVVVAWTLLRGPGEGLVWGFLGGIFMDLFSRTPLGISALALVISAYAASYAEGTLYRNHSALPLLVVLVITPIYDLVVLILLRVTGQAVDWLPSLLYYTLPATVIHVVLMLGVYRALAWLHRTTLRREVHL